MGKKGSTRWNDYEKAPLVEEAISIDLVALRRIGILNPRTAKWVSWTRPSSETPVAEGFAYLEIEPSGTRWLMAMIALFGKPKPLSVRLELEAFHPNLGGVRWFFRCPGCNRRVLKLYVAPSGHDLACRTCLGLTYRSVQQHDKRMDQARRDPVGFFLARESAPNTAASAWVTLDLYDEAMQARLRRGRTWGRDSMTEIKRILAAVEEG
jgi:hypothetical protein